MTQPPPPSDPRRPSGSGDPAQRPEQDSTPDSPPRPSPAVVVGVLMVVVLVLLLAGFFGMRAYLGADGTQATSASIWSIAEREPSSTPMSSTVWSPSRLA